MISLTVFSPFLPVKALAFPELTRIDFTVLLSLFGLKFFLQYFTAALEVSDFVKTPAIDESTGNSIQRTSVLLF